MPDNKTMHYLGFVHACKECGIEKSAADRLYKSAQGAGARRAARGIESLFRRFGASSARGAGHVEEIARATGERARQIARSTRSGLSRGYHAVADPAVRAAIQTRDAYRAASRGFRAGWRGVRPLTAAEEAAARERAMAKSLSFSPWKATGRFIMKHPIISTVGGITLGAGVTNWANRTMMDENKSKLPTLTPSEKLMFERAYNGFDLPGLGLDPTFFQGEEFPAYW